MIRLSMDTRFRLGTGLSVAIVFFFGFFSVYHLHFLDNEIQTDFKNDTQLIKITEEASNTLHELRTEFLKACQLDEENRFGKAFVKLNALQRLINHHSNDFERLQASSTSILQALKTVGFEMKTLEENKTIISPDFVKVSTLLQEFRGNLMDFRSREMRILNLKRNRVSEINQKFQSRMAIITIVTIVATVFLLMFFSHQIALPMRRIKDLIRSIQNGNYSISARSFTNDEVGQLITSLSAMAEHIETRDQLKVEKIGLEKRRFSALANNLSVPVMLINSDKQIAFANDEFLELFRFVWDDIYEIPLELSPLPKELKDKILKSISGKNWLQGEAMDIIGENYAYELNLSLLPVRNEKNDTDSVICILGQLETPKEAIPTS